MKLHRIKGVQGWYVRKDGTLVVFLDPKAGSDVVEQVLMAAGTNKVEIKSSEIQLMSYNPWGGIERAICSPPIGGYTAHHCASPLDNVDRSGQNGVLYTPDGKEVVGDVRILADYPFKPATVWEKLVALLLLLVGKEIKNRYDFALVEKKLDEPRTKRGVIFAGPITGEVAFAYDLALAPDAGRDVDTIERAEKLDAYVFHAGVGVVKRTYAVEGAGAVRVYAYNYPFAFEPAYALRAVDGQFDISVKPGYSGAVLLDPR